jgi:ATP-dependent Lon protease
MSVIERLISKKEELEERLSSLYHGGSQRRETLEYRVKKIDELIDTYKKTSTPDFSLSEAEEILDQQVGFTEQKRKILEVLETEEFRKLKNIQKSPSILCFVGPTGTGKTTFSHLLSQALKKKFFSVSLGGVSNSSDLVGASENSSGTEIGQLTKSLIESKASDPVILLDEIDKTKPLIHSLLIKILDSKQNQEVLDYYLDTKIDFSQVTFVATANDQDKIPAYLRSRMKIIELPEYSNEQKKEIANRIIQNFFEENSTLNSENFEVTSEALEKLIAKTKEKGVRQLKMAFDDIFNYCILQWAREVKEGETEGKVIVDPELVDQIIPQDFPNIDQKEEKDKPSNNWEDKQKELQQLIQNLQEKEKSNEKTWGNFWILLLVISLIFGLPLGLFYVVKKNGENQEQQKKKQ